MDFCIFLDLFVFGCGLEVVLIRVLEVLFVCLIVRLMRLIFCMVYGE